MPVSHARVTAVTSTDDELPGLLEVLAQVPDPRRTRGRRYTLVFMLAVAVACVLAGAKNFREIGDQAGDLPQEVLARLGGKPHPLLRTIIAPSEKRIRTLLQEIDAARLDELTGAGCANWRTPGGCRTCCARSRSTGNGYAASATDSRSSCSPRCSTSTK
jgi:hypothetical protein